MRIIGSDVQTMVGGVNLQRIMFVEEETRCYVDKHYPIVKDQGPGTGDWGAGSYLI